MEVNYQSGINAYMRIMTKLIGIISVQGQSYRY